SLPRRGRARQPSRGTARGGKNRPFGNLLAAGGGRGGGGGGGPPGPAENVHGTIVSDHTCYHFLFTEGVAGATTSLGMISPAEREAEIAPLVRRPGDITREEAARFVHVSADEFARPFDFNDDLGHFKWALATADSYRRIGRYLWQHEHPDVLMVYIEGTDSTAHLFGHLFRAKGLAGELAAQQERFGGAVEEMYRYADQIVGNFIDALD